jgi:hypothetical protein
MFLCPVASNFEETLREEETLARGRSLIPIRVRIELVVSYVERPFVLDTPIVLACERRDESVATKTAQPLHGSRRTLFEDSIVLNLLLLRKEASDKSEFDKKQVVTSKDTPLLRFEPVLARLTIRDKSPRDVVTDYAALDLAKFILGAHAVVEHRVKLQLGSIVCLRVICDLHGSIDC